jgi:FKBP-type peptidyl-prolyl cis-trans isomerase FklB
MTWSRIIPVALLIWLTGCQQPDTAASDSAPAAGEAAAEGGITGDVAQASYSMGYIVASNMDDRFAGSLDEEAFITGLRDRFAGQDRQVSEEQAQVALAGLVAKQEEAMQEKSTENLGAGSDFLAENGKREGVTTTASGLQYEVLVAADGAKPGATDTVSTHYHGTLIDGKVFDSSVTRGEPVSFPVNGVISGWTEALQLMGVGSKWRLFIPPELAYGSQGRPGIPPNATLIFDVELLGIADPS